MHATKRLNRISLLMAVFAVLSVCSSLIALGEGSPPADTAGGWVKYQQNPVIGAAHGTMFDIFVQRDQGSYRMWVGWRPRASIALFESPDGLHFADSPRQVLEPSSSNWEKAVNRPAVLKRGNLYHMWYTAQTMDHSAIGYATSTDGIHWKRMSANPVLSPTAPWEKTATLCADVMWDEDRQEYRMWYSAGPQAESDAIGYASSRDGITWIKSTKNPIFSGDPSVPWEQERAVGAHVEKLNGWYYMFYIGFHDIGNAQLGLARSRDGITHWQRHPENPIIRTGGSAWDKDSCYKPYALYDGTKWLLWYGGRAGGIETVGVALHEGADLGFPQESK